MQHRTAAVRMAMALLTAATAMTALADAAPAVVSTYPVAPFRIGATSLDLAFEVTGQPAQVVFSVTGRSASAGAFAGLTDLVLDRDQASAMPFHALVPLKGPFPGDGVLTVTAQAMGGDGTRSAAATFTFDAAAPAPALPEDAVKVRLDGAGNVNVEVSFLGGVVQGEASAIGVSSQALRGVHGSLSQAEPAAFALDRGVVAHPRADAPGKITFVVAGTGKEVPFDGVVIADIAVRDAFGRALHTSAVEFTDSNGFDTVLSLVAQPSPMLLSQGFGQREKLLVLAHMMMAGDADVSGADRGATYRTLDEGVAAVTRDGEVVARANGETDIEVSFGGVRALAHVIVDSTAKLDHLELGPVGATIPRVGASVQLALQGVLTNGRHVDLTPGILGAVYTVSDAATVIVSPDGKATARHPGLVSVTARYGDSTAQLVVEALDGPPEVKLVAPKTVTAGTSFEVKALATDDVGVARVEFILNGVPASTVSTPPYVIQLKAPPYGGPTMRVSAAVIDSGGQRTTSLEATVKVVDAPLPGSGPRWDAPSAGAMLIQGMPQVLRVTSGNGSSGSVNDYQVVRFSVDDQPIGSTSTPRSEARTNPIPAGDGDAQAQPAVVSVPLWEVTYVPPPGSAGSSASIRAEAVDANGQVVRAETLLVRIVADAPPLITVQRPSASQVDASAESPLEVSGIIGDDGLVFGLDAALLVDGTAVQTARLSAAPGPGGSPMGSAPFKFSWTPPASRIGKLVKLEIQAIDVGGNERRVALNAAVRGDQPPQVAILTPASNSTAPMGSEVSLTARVTDDTAGTPQVTWLVDGSAIGVSSGPPYELRYKLPIAKQNATHTIEAVARDAKGNEGRSSATLYAALDSSPPTAAIVVPRDGVDVTTTQDLLITVAGLDDVGVVRVEVLLDNTVILEDKSPNLNGGTKGSFVTHAVLSSAQLASGGDRHVGARAYDASGNVGRAPDVLIHTHPDRPPTVSFLGPAPGSEVTIGTKLEVMVDADDDVAVSKVALYEGTTPLGVDLVAPYRFTVPVASPARAMTLRAVATDSGGQTAEATLDLAVVKDTRPPLVGFRSPADGERAFAGRTVEVVVVAADNVAVANVQLTVEGASVGASQHERDELYEVYHFKVAVPASSGGSTLHLKAVATDTAQLTASRTLELSIVEDEPPTVSILDPAPHSTYREGEDVKIGYTVADDDGIAGIVGLSGGHYFGTMKVGTQAAPILDTSKEHALTVWAPIISKGEPPTVGVLARDTAGQDGKAEVVLDVKADTEPPSALLIAPQPQKSGPIAIKEGGSIGLSVQTEDDVRVKRVAVLIDGEELSASSGQEFLLPYNERFQEIRTPNPLGPGEIFVSRRYYGTFQGTASLSGVAAGHHQLSARAYDPAGNGTSTSSVELEIVPFVDRDPPKVTLALQGTPDGLRVVAGSTVDFFVSAVDDGIVQSLSATIDRVEVPPSSFTPEFKPNGYVSERARVLIPALAAGVDSRSVTFWASATDSVGHVGEASLTRDVVPDEAPSIAILSPTLGALLTEEHPEPARIEVNDDVGVVGALLVLSTSPVSFTDGDVVRIGAAAALDGAVVSKATLEYWGSSEKAEVSVSAGLVELRPQADGNDYAQGYNDPGQLALSIASPPGGGDVHGVVTYRYQVRDGAAADSRVMAFLAKSPAGRRDVVLRAPDYRVDLSFPSIVLEVESVTVQLDGGAGVTEVALAYADAQGHPGPQLRARAAGERIAVQRLSCGDPSPNRRTLTEMLRLPLGWAPDAAVLTAIAKDTAGHVGILSDGHPTEPDHAPPSISISVVPPYGPTVVADAPFKLHAAFGDNVAVDRIDALASGTARATLQPRFGARSGDLELTLPLPSDGAPVPLTAVATDRAGNAALSDPPVFVTVVPDAPPVIELLSIATSVESVGATELATGFTRLLQANPAVLKLRVTDDVWISSITVDYDGVQVYSQAFSSQTFKYEATAAFTPPVRADGTPTLLIVTATDNRGHQSQSRLIVETRKPQSPALAIAAPANGATVAEGSIQLFFEAVAGDDTGVASVDLYVNGQLAKHILAADAKPIPVLDDHLDEDGLPIALDPTVRLAAKALKAPFNDVLRLRTFTALVELPPGFVALDPGRDHTLLAVRALATDLEGNTSVVDRVIEVVKDASPPQVDILRPTLGRDIVEGTPVLVEVAARDNVFVDRVEILAGPSESDLQVVHTAGGFPPTNAVPGSPFDVYAPVVSYQLTVPLLSALGAIDSSAYFVAARARDVSGNWTAPAIVQYIDVIRDREPAASIIAPSEYAKAVEGTQLPVTISAEDDVAIASVALYVDDVMMPVALRAPPFLFQVPVPAATPGRLLKLRGRAVDTYGHAVFTQVVQIPVVGDAPPTVAVAAPRATDKLTEGRDIAFLVAAQDDAEIASVEATVEGGVNGTVKFFATSRPYSFRVPLPYGSAGRTLTFKAKATDSAKHEASAQPVSVQVVTDTQPPTVSFLSPANGSQIVEGLRLDVEARADDDVAVVNTVFELNGTVVATMPAAPYRFSYQVQRGDKGKVLGFTARATDSSGNKGSATVSVTVVEDTPPAVQLIPPTQIVAGIPAQLKALANDDVAVAQVAFHVGLDSDQPPQIDQRFILPYEVSYVADKALVGKQLTIRARAIDTAGHETWSAPAHVTVSPDLPPTIQIKKPLPGSLVFDGAAVRIQAEATDPDGGVRQVAFFVDGRKVDTAFTTAGIPGAPSTYAGSFFAPVGSGNRTFTLTAVATDSAGQETVSAPVVIGTVHDTVPPEVELVDPPDLDLVTEGENASLGAVAEDNSAVAKVEFLVEGALLGSTGVSELSVSKRPIFRYPWLTPTGAGGTYRTIQARATDTSSNVGESQTVKVELGLRRKSLWVNPPVGEGGPPPLGAFAARDDGLLLLGRDLYPVPNKKITELEFGRALEAGLQELVTVQVDGPTVTGAFHTMGGRRLALVTATASDLDTRVAAPSLVVFDIADLSLPQRMGAIDLSGPEVHGVAARDRLAFVANGEAGVVVIDLTDPTAPMRAATIPVVGTAQDVAVAGDRLLVAAGSAGLRVLDLTDPEIPELGFVALPGGARAVAVRGDFAFVGCDGASAEVAVVDIAHPSAPIVKAYLSHAPARRDLRAQGITAVAVAGNLVLATAELTDQDGNAVKGMLTASAVRPDGTGSKVVRANLATAGFVAQGAGTALAVDGITGVAAFTMPKLLVVNSSPADGAEQVAPAAPELVIDVELTAPPAQATLTASSVVLRAQDQTIGPVVPTSVVVNGRHAIVTPSVKLDLATAYFLTLDTSVATDAGLALSEKFVTRFRTRGADEPPPIVLDVVPGAGPADGGMPVHISGLQFAPGARVFFSGQEATDVAILDGGTALTARTPASVMGPATVTVMNPNGLQGSLVGGFEYVDVLQANLVSPATGRLAGHDLVVVSGSGFERGAVVSFNGAPATEVRVLSPGKVQCYTPPGDFGPADVVVENPDGRRAVAPGAYLYSELTISSIIGRYDPMTDGAIRPAHRLPRLPPRAVRIQDGRAWLISPAAVATTAKTAAELLLKSEHGAVSIVDVHDPKQASVMGGVSLVPPYDPFDLAVRGNLAYVVANAPDLPLVEVAGEGGPSLLVVDGTDPVGPKMVAAVPFEGEAHSIALVDDVALVAAGKKGVAIFSIAEPTQPVLLGYVSQFVLDGVSRAVEAQYVVASGRYAVVTVGPSPSESFVVDLGVAGLPAIGKLPAAFTSAALAGSRGLAASGWLKSLNVSAPDKPRYPVDVPTLVGLGGGLYSVATGPQFGAAVGMEPAAVHLVAVTDPAQPRPIDAIDLFPAISASGIAIDRDVIAVSIGATFKGSAGSALDALAVIGIPFPMVLASRPPDGATGVPVGSLIQIDLSRTVGDADTSTARVVRVDGSAIGTPIPAAVSTAGTSVTIAPAAPLATGARYRILVDGLHDAVTGSPMPAAYTAEFTTATSATAVPLTVSSLTPRQGASAGGTIVTLSGTGLEPAVEVRFGGQPATVEEVADDGTSATVRTPAGAAGAATLQITNSSGTNLTRVGAFLYVDPLQVFSVSPSRGPASGGTRVLVNGRGFAPVGQVSVAFGSTAQKCEASAPDGKAAGMNVRVLGTDRLEVFTPNCAYGAMDVTVTNPDAAQATLQGAFTFDRPTMSSIASSDRLYDAAVYLDWAFVASGSSGLEVIDLSGRYTTGELAGLTIPPDLRDGLVDENHDGVDDRVVGKLVLDASPMPDVFTDCGLRWAEAVAVSYPPEGGDRLFLGTRDYCMRMPSKEVVVDGGSVRELDISNPFKPRQVAVQRSLTPVTEIDARGDRLLAAANADGLQTYDITHPPFPVGALPLPPGAQSLGTDGPLAAIGTGIRNDGWWSNTNAVSGGKLQLASVASAAAVRGSMSIQPQRVRVRKNIVFVAAGDDGFVIVDATHPDLPVERSRLPLGGFAWDVRIAGDVAYVAAGAAGVAVIDISNLAAPHVLYHVTGATTGALGGEARTLAVAGGRLVTLRNRGYGGWSIEFGLPTELTVEWASVEAGQVVPRALPSVTLAFSSTIDPDTADGAFSFTADGLEVPGVLERGTASEMVSTVVFRPSTDLPAGADLTLRVETTLATPPPNGRHLVAPYQVVVPRIGPTAGGLVSELLGDGFDVDAQVFIGGAPAPVLSSSPTRITFAAPPGPPGLADVEVVNGSGVRDRRSGGYWYSAPVLAAAASPRFLNPRGGSVVHVTGAGFLPPWSSPLGSTRVLVRGLPALSVKVSSTTDLTLVAPPGRFGPAEVTALSADGLERSTAPSLVGYGLPFSGEERAVAVTPVGLAQDPALPLLVYSAAGPSAWGNTFQQPYIGAYTGTGTVPESFRVVGYDVTLAGRPRASVNQIVDAIDKDVDIIAAFNTHRLPPGVAVPTAEVNPDSQDVAVRGANLYVANGQSGLAVLDASQPLQLPLKSKEAWNESSFAMRVAATPTGALVVRTNMAGLCPSQKPPPAEGESGRVELYDTRFPGDPVRLVSFASEGEPSAVAEAHGLFYAVSGHHWGYVNCPPDGPPPPFDPPPLYSAVPTLWASGGSTSLSVYDATGSRLGSVSLGSGASDVAVIRDVAVVARPAFGLDFVDVSDSAHPQRVAQIALDASVSNEFDPGLASLAPGYDPASAWQSIGRATRLRVAGDLLFVSAEKGGVLLVDVSDPRHPQLVSGGNIEFALDAIPVTDRIIVAGKDRITELSVPFTFATGTTPARGELVPPALAQITARFNRALAPPSVNEGSVRLLALDGTAVALDLSVTADNSTLAYAIVAKPTQALQPGSEYELQVDTTVTDQRGGSLLLPLRSRFRTAGEGSRLPIISGVAPTTATRSGGALPTSALAEPRHCSLPSRTPSSP